MTSPHGARRRRVPAMAPEDRRAALIAATVPLLHEHGPDISTRQIAQAAGVAEGTIFGVFKDKPALITAAMVQALDPQPTLDDLASIDPAADLRERLVTAAELIVSRFRLNAPLLAASRRMMMAAGPDSDAAREVMAARQRLLAALTEVVAPDAGRLRCSPEMLAGMVLVYCAAGVVAPFGDLESTSSREIVSLLLDGVLIVPTTQEVPRRC